MISKEYPYAPDRFYHLKIICPGVDFNSGRAGAAGWQDPHILKLR